MKKVLLPVLFFASVLSVNAQDCIPGVSASGIYDDFSDENPPMREDEVGVFPWGASKDGFTATIVRNAAEGTLDVTVTQEYGNNEPFGISLGDDNGDLEGGIPYTTDITENPTFSITLTNASDSVVAFKLAVQDADGDQINVSSAAEGEAFGDAWMYEFKIVLNPGQTKTLTGDLSGGLHADYSDNTYKQNFDYDKFSNVLLTAVNNNQNAGDGYKQVGLLDALLRIDEIRVGDCPFTTGKVNKIVNNFSISPNPATSVATISYSTSVNAVVNVMDLAGNVVKTVEGTTTSAAVNVSDLNAGIYMVSILENGAPVSTQKLVVRK